MKKIIYILSLIIIPSLVSYSQEATKESLKNDLDQYETLFANQQYEELLYYVNPKLFEIVPKEMFVEAISSMLAGDESMEITIHDFTPTYIMDVTEINERMFSLVEYELEMDMKFIEGFEDQEEADFMKSMMELTFGEGNIEVDQTEGVVSIDIPSAMFAEFIEDRWTFTSYEASQQAMLDQILGKEIQDEILKVRSSLAEPVSN